MHTQTSPQARRPRRPVLVNPQTLAFLKRQDEARRKLPYRLENDAVAQLLQGWAFAEPADPEDSDDLVARIRATARPELPF
ncbi:hypothetical protein SS50377_20434 [Spironucleus salmonicida]|nr:hypothetical protein SS50377_20434 [Spironucleus salmonicida]|eukprot:EST45592.1 Hypothetical protein SS50377_14439 [Spironucleus salmonicida]